MLSHAGPTEGFQSVSSEKVVSGYSAMMSVQRNGPGEPILSQRAQFGATSACVSWPGGGRTGVLPMEVVVVGVVVLRWRTGGVSGVMERGRKDVPWRAREKVDGREASARKIVDFMVVAGV